MIWLTRINGTEVVINADLIESIEPTPDTIITLVDGKKFIVSESAGEVIDKVTQFRAALLRASTDLVTEETPPAPVVRIAPEV